MGLNVLVLILLNMCKLNPSSSNWDVILEKLFSFLYKGIGDVSIWITNAFFILSLLCEIISDSYPCTSIFKKSIFSLIVANFLV